MSSDEELKMVEAINKFREDPTSIKPTIEKFITAFGRLSPDSDIEKYNNLSALTDDLPKCQPLHLNEQLCEIAKKKLEEKEEGVDFVEFNEECEEKLPKGCPSNNACVLMTYIDYPDLAIIKLNENDFDKNHDIRTYLLSDDITQISFIQNHINQLKLI